MASFKILSEKGQTLVVSAQGVGRAYMNALRRTLLADIPMPGIMFVPTSSEGNDITFLTNTSCLHNEMLGQRISLIPLNFSEKEIDEFSQQKYKFVCRVKNTGSEVVDVTSADISILDESGKPFPKEFRDRIFPKDPITGDHIFIVMLKANHSDTANGEELHFEARARIGIPSTYVVFACASKVTYDFEVDEEEARAKLQELLKSRSEARSAVGAEPLTQSEISNIERDFNAVERQMCYKKDEDEEPTNIILTVRSERRSLSARKLISKALEVLVENAKKVASSEMVVKSSSGVSQVLIKGVGATVGHALKQHVEKNSEMDVGCHVPHPLEASVNLKFNFRDEEVRTQEQVETLVKDFAVALSNDFLALKKSFDALQ